MKQKRTLQLLTPFFVLAALFASAVVMPVVHATGGLTISPSAGTVNKGANVTVTIRANTGGQAVDATNLTVVYDTAKLQFVSATPAGITSGANYTKSGSTVTGGAYTTTPVNSSSLTLVKIVFKALVGSGSASFSFSTSGVYGTTLDAGGVNINPTLGSATINFATPSTPAPTPTPTPTPAPTPTPTQPSTPTTPAPSSPSTPSNPSTPDKPTSPSTPNKPSTPSDKTPVEATDTGVIASVKIGVFDKNHKPLVKKKVTLHSEPQTVTTDEKGYATFSSVPAGTHTLEYKLGGKTYNKTVALTAAGNYSVIYKDLDQSNGLVWAWFGVGAVVLLALVGAGIVMLRKRRAIPFAPQDGSATYGVPIGGQPVPPVQDPFVSPTPEGPAPVATPDELPPVQTNSEEMPPTTQADNTPTPEESPEAENKPNSWMGK